MAILNYSDWFKLSVKNLKTNPAIICYENNLYKIYTYEDLHRVSINISPSFANSVKPGQVIGVLVPKSPLIPVIVNLSHEHGCAFVFLNHEHGEDINCDIINYFNVSIILSHSEYVFKDFVCDSNLSEHTKSFNMELYIWKRILDGERYFIKDISYCIRTSGSTGTPKYVTVPHECIYPNICDFESLFSVKSCDVIYFSTPLTFDPSVIELYLAAKCGASLLIAPQSVDLIFSDNYSVTIWQTTPSKFLMMGSESIKEKILIENSRLRILALGGEPLNCNFSHFKHKYNTTKIFNLYGITEVSCWASINEIKDFESNGHFRLGMNLTDTIIKIFNKEDKCVRNELGYICIGSSNKRICYINKDTSQINDNIVWRNTGDLGIETNDGIYFKGREDRTIKRFGHKINLLNIESVLLRCAEIKQCIFLWDGIKNILVLFYCSYSMNETDVFAQIKDLIDAHSIPDNVIRLESIPTNNHGKVDMNKLKEIYSNKSNNNTKEMDFEKMFVELINDLFQSNDFTIKDLNSKSFMNIGGTSLMAVQFVNRLKILTGKSFSNFYGSLLIPDYPLIKVIEKLVDETQMKRSIQSISDEDNHVKKNKISKIFDIDIVWKYDMKKCIDSTPTLYKDSNDQSYIMIGSHSGQVAVLDSQSGLPIFSLEVKSRVEAPVLCFKNNGRLLCAVGCYDGSFWCFSPLHKIILWKVSLKAMIKSKACQIDNAIFVATYDGAMYKLNMDGEEIKFVKIAEKGITSDLVYSKTFIYTAALDGTCAKVSSKDLSILWSHKFTSPVFAKPAFLNFESQVLFNEVSGKIHCVDVDSGNLIWIFDNMRGLLFSSCTIVHTGNADDLFVGCHDKHAYKIRCVHNERPDVEWRSTHGSEVYATPGIFKNGYIISVSTDGRLYVIDMFSGDAVGEFKICGEVFSSPTIDDDLIFVGCRDDRVYCLRVTARR